MRWHSGRVTVTVAPPPAPPATLWPSRSSSVKKHDVGGGGGGSAERAPLCRLCGWGTALNGQADRSSAGTHAPGTGMCERCGGPLHAAARDADLGRARGEAGGSAGAASVGMPETQPRTPAGSAEQLLREMRRFF